MAYTNCLSDTRARQFCYVLLVEISIQGEYHRGAITCRIEEVRKRVVRIIIKTRTSVRVVSVCDGDVKLVVRGYLRECGVCWTSVHLHIVWVVWDVWPCARRSDAPLMLHYRDGRNNIVCDYCKAMVIWILH